MLKELKRPVIKDRARARVLITMPEELRTTHSSSAARNGQKIVALEKEISSHESWRFSRARVFIINSLEFRGERNSWGADSKTNKPFGNFLADGERFRSPFTQTRGQGLTDGSCPGHALQRKYTQN